MLQQLPYYLSPNADLVAVFLLPESISWIGAVLMLFMAIVLARKLRKANALVAETERERSHLQRQLEDVQERSRTTKVQLKLLFNKYKMLKKQREHSQEKTPVATEYSYSKESIRNDEMASFGHLTQGIVREINDPLSIIYNGVETLKITFSDLAPVVDRLGQFNSHEDHKILIEELKEMNHHQDVGELTSDIRELMEGITNGANRAMDIMKRLVSFNPLVDAQMEPTDIHQSIDMALHILEEEIGDHLKVSKYYDSTLEEIEARSGQINQIFLNLLMNSIQAIPTEKADGEISIYTEKRDEDLIIRIHDNGVGISKKDLSHIFQPFFTTRSREMGSGLGLSISSGIVKDHGGQIEVRSVVGEGTEFEIRLPKRKSTH